MPIDKDLLKRGLAKQKQGPQVIGPYQGPIDNMEYGSGLSDALKYRPNIYKGDDLNKIKADGQSEWKKGFNAVVGGLASGLLTAVEDTGYILDFENNLKNLADLENVESNWLSDLAKEGKHAIDEAMPIYTEDPNKIWDWNDSGQYWKALKGILDSAVGFAIPGAGATKVVGAAQRLARLGRYMNFLKTSKMGQQLTNSLAAGYITNYGEGKMMALEQYEDSLEKYKHDLWERTFKEIQSKNLGEDPGVLTQRAQDLYNQRLAESMPDFERIAGEEADKFMFKNKAFMLTDAMGLHGLYRGQGLTRNIIKDPSFKGGLKAMGKADLDNPIIQGLKESAEEIGQNVLQMEGKFQTAQRMGQETESNEDLWKRALEFATSDQAILEGAMGFFGGGPQRVLTKAASGQYSAKHRKQQREAYEDQQFMMDPEAKTRTVTRKRPVFDNETGEETFEEYEVTEYNNQWFIENRLSEFDQTRKLIDKAMERGEKGLAETLKNQMFLKMASENFGRGTTANLERALKDVIESNLSEEEVAEKGWDPDYKEQAREQLKLLKKMENRWNRYTKYENREDVFYNRMSYDTLHEQFWNAYNKRKEAEALTDQILEMKGLQRENLTEEQYQEYMQMESVQDEIYYEELRSAIHKQREKLDSDYRKITSDEYQSSLRKMDRQFKRIVKEQAAKARAEAKRQKDKAKAESRSEKQSKTQPKNNNADESTVSSEEQGGNTGGESQTSGTDSGTTQPKTRSPKTQPSNPGTDGSSATSDTQQTEAEPVSDEEYADFVDNGNVSDHRLHMIASKIQSGKQNELSEREKAIHAAKTQEVEEMLRLRKQHEEERKRKEKGTANEQTRAKQQQQENTDEIFTERDTDSTTEQNTKAEELLNETNPDGIEVHDKVALLSRNYIRKGQSTFIDLDNNVIRSMDGMHDILFSDLVGEGTKIRLVVVDDPDVEISSELTYQVSTQGKTTWGAIRDNEQDKTNRIPIQIQLEDGTAIGWLHEMNYANEFATDDSSARLYAVRKAVLEKGPIETTVTSNNGGKFFRYANNEQRPVGEAMPNATMAVVKNGELISNGEVVQVDNPESLANGMTYTVIESAGKRYALQVNPTKFTDTESGRALKRTILKVIEIFTDGDSRTAEQEEIVNQIMENTRNWPGGAVNITTAKGMDRYLSAIMLNSNIHGASMLWAGRNEKDKSRGYLNNNKIKPGAVIFTIKNGAISGSRDKGVEHVSLSKNSPESFRKGKGIEVFESLLDKAYVKIDKNLVGSDKNIVLIGEDGQATVEKYQDIAGKITQTNLKGVQVNTSQGERTTYRFQPRITFDISFAPLPLPEQNAQSQPANESGPNAMEVFNKVKGLFISDPNEMLDKWNSIAPMEQWLTEAVVEWFTQNKNAYNKAMEDYAKYSGQKASDAYKRLMVLQKSFEAAIKRASLKAISMPDTSSVVKPPLEKPVQPQETQQEMSEEELASHLGLSDGQIGDINILVDADEEPNFEGPVLTEAKVAELIKATQNMIIEGLGLKFQTELVETMASDIFRQLIESEEGRMEFAETMETYKDLAAKAVAAAQKDIDTLSAGINSGTLSEKNTLTAKKVLAQRQKVQDVWNNVLSNWDRLSQFTFERVMQFSDTAIDGDPENLRWDDNSAFTVDTKESVAPMLKRFLALIPERDADGNTVKTVLGTTKYLAFDKVYNILQRTTPNRRPDFNELMEAIDENTKAYPFLAEVKAELMKADQQMKNLFVGAMSNHYVNMQLVEWSRGENGEFTLRALSANSNAIALTIFDIWRENLKRHDDVFQVEGEEEEYFIGPELIKRLTDAANTWGHVTPDKGGLKYWFEQLGITLSEKTVEDILSGAFQYGNTKSFQDHVNNPGGLIHTLVKNLSTRGKTSLSDNDPLNNTVVKRLSRHDAQYSQNALSNSLQTGGKTVYAYGQNKYAIVRHNELKRLNTSTKDGKKVKTNTLLTRLAKYGFSGNSLWLYKMAKTKNGELQYADNGEIIVDENGAFLTNLRPWTTSLEPLRKKGSSSREGRELYNISAAEHELFKMGMLMTDVSDESGNNKRIINVTYPTNSDKTTQIGFQIEAADLQLDREGNLDSDSLELLYEALVAPEIQRVRQARQGGIDANNKAYSSGARWFMLMPEINNIEGIFYEDGRLNEDIEGEMKQKIIEVLQSYVKQLAEKKVSDWNDMGIITKSSELDKRYRDHLSAVDENKQLQGAATDMVAQYLVANAEIFKMFIGDPAQFYKTSVYKDVKKRLVAEGVVTQQQAADMSNREVEEHFTSDDIIQIAEDTFLNVGKRLAGDIAPGQELAGTDRQYHPIKTTKRRFGKSKTRKFSRANDTGKQYKTVVLQDFKGTSTAMKQLKELFKDDPKVAAQYGGFESTDAQEYTTWEEHLNMMLWTGKLSEEEYTNFYDKLSQGEDLGKKDLKKVLQPMKPVYVYNTEDKSGTYDRRVYVKSSSFPLIPQLVRGLELEKLAKAMQTQGIQRAAFATAVKVGAPAKLAQVFNTDGTIKDDLDFTDSQLTLERAGLRIQQQIPYDGSKASINRVSQAMKNFMVNMMDVEGFKVKWHNDGKPINGRELHSLFLENYEKLFEMSKEELLEELQDSDGSFSQDKIIKLLRREAIERDYPMSEVEMTEYEDFLRMMPYLPSADRFEALLNSIITNRIVKQKMPGKSYVLGAQEGFKTLDELDNDTRAGITFTPAFDGELKSNQVLIPWKFKTPDGKLINMRQFVGKDGKIDMDRLSPEVLKIFGMRIPNQGPMSQRSLEIAGFLPKASGDLIIAPRDLVVQMGSDFDVDKLYTYMYNVEVVGSKEHPQLLKFVYSEGKHNKHKKYKFHKKIDTDTEREMTEVETIRELTRMEHQNKVIDIMHAVHENPDRSVQKQIHTPLGFWHLPEVAQKVTKARRARMQGGDLFTGLSDAYQRQKYINATAGKSGTGVFAKDSAFNATIQGVEKPMNLRGKGKRPYTVTFGNRNSGKQGLNSPMALDGKTYKSDVISGYLSAAVDNEKEQLLDKLNINNATFGVVTLLNQMGFTDEVLYFITQDIIFDYAENLAKVRSSLNEEEKGNPEARAMKMTLDQYEKKAQQAGKSWSIDDNEVWNRYKAPYVKDMEKMIVEGENSQDYFVRQLAILEKFKELQKAAKSLGAVQAAVNPDSKGMPKDMVGLSLKQTAAAELGKKLINGEDLIHPVGKAKTVNAIVHRNATNLAVQLWLSGNNGVSFPYASPSTLESLLEGYQLITQKELFSDTEKSNVAREMWNDMKSYLFTAQTLGLSRKDVKSLRHTLTHDERKKEKGDNNTVSWEHTKMSLASIVKALQDSGQLGNNAFFNKLIPHPGYKGNPARVDLNAAVSEDFDPINTYRGFIDLLIHDKPLGTFNGVEYTTRKLASDLIAYAYVTGGVQKAHQFIRYVPPAYLKTIGFFDGLFAIEDAKPDVQIFLDQWAQHNAKRVPQVKFSEAQKSADGKDWISLTSFAPDNKVDTFWYQETVKGKELSFPVPFVAVKNSKGTLALFKLKDGVYERIDTLGNKFGYKEYDFQSAVGESQIPKNRGYRKDSADVNNPSHEDGKVQNTDKATKGGRLMDTGGRTTHRKNLGRIKKATTNKYLQTLADALSKRPDLTPENMRVTKSKNPLIAGRSFVDERGASILEMNPHVPKFEDVNEFAKTYLHETMHLLTRSQLIRYENYLKDTEGTRESRMRKWGLTPKSIAAMAELRRVHLMAREELMKDPKAKELMDKLALREQYKEQYKNEEITQEQLLEKVDALQLSTYDTQQYYGIYNLKEFVAEALTNEKFQRRLNDITDNQGTTWLDRILDKLKDLFASLGFEVKKGSVLETAVVNTFSLIEGMPATEEAAQLKDIKEEKKSVDSPLAGMAGLGTNSSEYPAVNANPVLEINRKLMGENLVGQDGRITGGTKDLNRAAEIVKGHNQASLERIGVPLAKLNWADRKVEFDQAAVDKYRKYMNATEFLGEFEAEKVNEYKEKYNIC